MSNKNKNIDEFLDDDDDKNKGAAQGAGYVPKQSLDPKIFLNDMSSDVVPGIRDDDFCVSCFASPLSKCKCGKKVPAPKPVGGSKDAKAATASSAAKQKPPPK